MDGFIEGLESWFLNHSKKFQENLYSDSVPIYPIIVYSISAFSCLFFSTIFHIYFPLSKRVNDVL